MNEIKLPQLQGTEKQIAWANDIRESAIELGLRMAFPKKLQEKYGPERTLQIKNIILGVAASYQEAAQWINYSKGGGFVYGDRGHKAFMFHIVQALNDAHEDKLAGIMEECL